MGTGNSESRLRLPRRTVPGATLLLGFLPLSTRLSPSFLVSPGSISLINHFQDKFSSQGLYLGNLTKTSIKEIQRWSCSSGIEGAQYSYCGHCWGGRGRSHGQVAMILLLWRQTCWAVSQGCFLPGMMLLWKHRAWSLKEHSVLISAAFSICFVSH